MKNAFLLFLLPCLAVVTAFGLASASATHVTKNGGPTPGGIGYVSYTPTKYSCTFTTWTVFSNFVYHDGSGNTHSFPTVQISNFNGAPCGGNHPPDKGFGASSDGYGLQVNVQPVPTDNTPSAAVNVPGAPNTIFPPTQPN